MADRFKEYKAYIPPKWQVFDDFPAGSIKKKMGFTSCMASVMGISKVGSGMRSTSEPPRDVVQRAVEVDKRLRGSEKWIGEMQVYCKEQEDKKSAKERTDALEADLRRKQHAAMLRREKALEAPLLDGKKMPVAYHAFQHSHPQEVGIYSGLLRTAAAIDQQKRREKCEDFLEAKQSKTNTTVNAHLDHIEKRNEERNKDMKGMVAQLRNRTEDAQEHAENLRERRTEEKDAHRRAEHERALKREEEQTQRRLQMEEEERMAQAKRSALINQRVKNAHRRAAEQEAEFDRNFKLRSDEVSERLALRETERRRVVGLGLVEKARERAEASYDEKRRVQLDGIRTAEENRERRMKDKNERDREDRTDWKHKLQSREQTHEEVSNQKWTKRTKEIEDAIDHHREPIPERPHVEEVTKARLERAIAARAATNAKAAQDRETERQRQWEQEDRAFHAQSTTRAQQHASYMEAEQRRMNVRIRGQELTDEFQDQTDNMVASRMAHSDEVSHRLEKERKTRVERESEERSKKIREALELVNVTKTVDRMNALSRKEQRVAERNAERSARRQKETSEKRAADDARHRHMVHMIEQAANDRHNRHLASVNNFNARCGQAQANRDDEQHKRSVQLHDDFNMRLTKAHDAVEAKEQKFLGLRERLNQQDEADRKRLAEERRDRDAYLRERAEEQDMRTEEAKDSREKQIGDWLERTTSKLESAYARGAMSPAHPLTESFGNFTSPLREHVPMRAHTTSPRM